MKGNATSVQPKKPILFWVLSGICAVLSLALIALSALYFTSSEDEVMHLLAAGQRLTIHAKTGEVSGSMRGEVTKKETTETAEPKKEEEPKIDLSGFDVADENEPVATASIEVVEGGEGSEGAPSFAAEASEVETSMRVYPKSKASLKKVSAALGEPSPHGIVPKIGEDGSPSRYYARPFSHGKNPKPVIGLLISGLGHHNELTDRALNLPPEVSLSFDIYAKNTPLYAESARNLGHEAWLDFALQPRDFPASDPGPDALLAKAKPEDIERNLLIQLAKMVGYVGFVMPANESFSDDSLAFLGVTKNLKERGVALLASDRPVNSAAGGYIRSNPEVAQLADSVIDADLSEAAIMAKLEALEALAKKNGNALAVARAYPVTLNALEAWNKKLAEKSIVLAPVSAFYIVN